MGPPAVPLTWQRRVHDWAGSRDRDLIRLGLLNALGEHGDGAVADDRCVRLLRYGGGPGGRPRPPCSGRAVGVCKRCEVCPTASMLLCRCAASVLTGPPPQAGCGRSPCGVGHRQGRVSNLICALCALNLAAADAMRAGLDIRAEELSREDLVAQACLVVRN